MPLGLRNSAQTFQRTMNYLLRDLDFVRCYQDDILVLSASPRTTSAAPTRAPYHLEACEAVRQLGEVPDRTLGGRFRRLPHLRARIRATSSQSRSDRSIPEALRLDTAATLYRHAEFLPPMLASRCRAHVSPHGSSPRTAEEKGEACMERSSRRGIRAHQAGYGFSGTISFLPSRPASCSAHRRLEYGYWCRVESAPRRRRLDAAGFFFSQKLSPTQQRYSTYDRELLAIFEAIKYFSEDTRGSKLHHHDRSSPSVLRPRAEVGQVLASTVTSARLHLALRCQDRLHARRRENPVADALSRIDAITMPTTLNSAQISAEQQRDEQLTHLRGKAKLKLHDVVIDGLSLVCVEQRNGLKPYLPESLRRQAFDTAHTLSHPSGRATVKRVALLYFWPSMSKDIVRWAKQCVPCQQSKVHRHNRAELGNFVTPDGRFDHVHIDIVKMPLHQGFQNCLTMIDRYTRWPQAIPIGDMSAQTVAKAFFHGWISFFGTPLTITTDQGAQFEGKLLAQLCKLVGAKHVHTSPYHPQANSMVERMHRTLKAALKCSPRHRGLSHFQASSSAYELPSKRTCKRRQRRWFSARRYAYPGSSSHDKNRTKRRRQSSFRLYGACQAIRPVPASRHVQHRPFVFKDLATSDYVFRRLDTILKPLEQPYTGPHRVIRRINERNFVVDVNGVAKTLSTISSSQPTWMSPTAEHHRQHRSSQLPRSLHQHGESPFHSLRKLPSPLGGEWLWRLKARHRTLAGRAVSWASRPASPAAESAPVDLSHLRTAAKREKKKAVKSLRA
ncbi:unnamed protein product, partial [Trichogramma brassicae]